MIFDDSVELGEAFLAHYGVPGMHWGIRKAIADMFKSERAQYHQTMANPASAAQVHKIRKTAVGIGLGVAGAYAVGGLVLHMHANPAPYIKAAGYANRAIRTTMGSASRMTAGARVIFDNTGKMTYYAPGARVPMRPNFDPTFNRQAIGVARRALNP